MPIIILPQCLWKNTAHSRGREGVCAVAAALSLAPAWKLITLGPPAQEGGGDRSEVPQDKGALEAHQAEGMGGLLPPPMELSRSERLVHTRGIKECVYGLHTGAC